jgi:trehalose 6-phosphate phosphatase
MAMPALQGDSPPPLLSMANALYIDFDGTLADLAPLPDAVEIRRELPGLLLALRARLGGAVAIITGRRLAKVDAMLAPALLPGAGLHGAELRIEAGGAARLRRTRSVAALVRALHERFDGVDGLLVEDKGAAVALHFRLAPARAEECIEALRGLATDPALEVITGSMVVEARPRGANKGHALLALLRYRPFADRIPVFVGDDVTDEDGFRTAARQSGWGVKVGTGASCAAYRLDTVDGVHLWLRASLQALEKRGRT